MKRITLFVVIIGVVLFIPILFLSCDEECVCNPPEEHIPEYHMLYGPGGEASIEHHEVYIISTRTGELIDSIRNDGWPYKNLLCSNDGSKVVFTYGYGPDKLTWVKDYPSNTLVSRLENWGGGKLYLDPQDRFLALSNNELFAIFSFPDLLLVFVDSTPTLGGGFLTSDSSAFFYREDIDSLYTLDFSNPASVTKSVIQLKLDGLPVRPTMAQVDYINNRLIILTAFMDDPRTSSVILVYDTQNLGKIQQLHSRLYGAIELHPDMNRVFCYKSGATAEVNLIDIYYINSNTVQSFIEYDNIITELPFHPGQVLFTPDGNQMYILNGIFGPESVIGIQIADKRVIQYIKIYPADVRRLRINPVDRSD